MADRLRVGIAVLHGEEKEDDERDDDDGRASPPPNEEMQVTTILILGKAGNMSWTDRGGQTIE